MKEARSRPPLDSMGALRHPCDLALVLFFHRHPRVLLSSARLAAFVGYNLEQVAQSVDLLTEAGVLEQSQHPTLAARLYVFKTPASGWLAALIELASTHEGQRNLIAAQLGSAFADGSAEQSPDAKDSRSRVARRRNKSR